MLLPSCSLLRILYHESLSLSHCAKPKRMSRPKIRVRVLALSIWPGIKQRRGPSTFLLLYFSQAVGSVLIGAFSVAVPRGERELIRFTLPSRYLNEANLHSYATRVSKYGDTIKLSSRLPRLHGPWVRWMRLLSGLSVADFGVVHDNDSNAATVLQGTSLRVLPETHARGIQNSEFAIS